MRDALDTSRRLDLPRYDTLQPKYNLYDRSDYEGPLSDLCVKEEIGVIPYYALANGFLTGKYRGPADFGKSAARGSRMGSYLNDRGKHILAALDALSAKHKVKPAAIALAWLMSRPMVIPIASATKPEQLDDFAAAARVKLGADDLKTLDTASAG